MSDGGEGKGVHWERGAGMIADNYYSRGLGLWT